MKHLSSILLYCSLLLFYAKAEGKGIAVVIDPDSYTEAKEEIILYCNALEADGLKNYLLIDHWHNPDSIKANLIKLYRQKTNPIEGAVFIGDPTLHFSSVDPLINMAALFSEKQNDKSFWAEQLDAAFPEMQTLALRMLYENRHDHFPARLLETYQQSESEIVRMECLKILTAYDDDHFIKCLALAVNDSYEMIQRQAVYLIGKSGDERLINPLLSVFIRNNASKRVAFATRNSLGSFAKEDLLAAFDLVFDQEQHFVQPDTMKIKLQKSLSNLAGRWSDDFDELFDSKTKDKTKSFAINMLRNYNYHPYVGRFCAWLVNQSDERLKVQMLEALGWFTISCEKDKIIAACREIAENPDETENVKHQAMKTAARLNAEWWR
jgi:hypothetical protein